MTAVRLLALVPLVVVSACADGSGAGSGEVPVPLTDDGIASVVADHVDRDPKRVDLEHDGSDLVLAWQELGPEEDPGVVYVIDRRDGEDVIAHYSGASITGDPRELDLGVTVDEMAEIVIDGRLTLAPAE